jgi:hypothetical protein
VWYLSARNFGMAISSGVSDVSKSIGINLAMAEKDINKKDASLIMPAKEKNFLIERLMLTIDRLIILQSQSASEMSLKLREEPITACDLRNYRTKSLLAQLIEFTQSPLSFFNKTAGAAKEVYFNQQTLDESLLPGWWESSVLISLTAFISSIPTRFFEQRFGHSGKNHLRFLADIRILSLVMAWTFIVWILGRFIGSWQMIYFILLSALLRHLLILDIINSFQQLVVFLFGVGIVFMWALGLVNSGTALGVLGVLSFIKMLA